MRGTWRKERRSIGWGSNWMPRKKATNRWVSWSKMKTKGYSGLGQTLERGCNFRPDRMRDISFSTVIDADNINILINHKCLGIFYFFLLFMPALSPSFHTAPSTSRITTTKGRLSRQSLISFRPNTIITKNGIRHRMTIFYILSMI